MEMALDSAPHFIGGGGGMHGGPGVMLPMATLGLYGLNVPVSLRLAEISGVY